MDLLSFAFSQLLHQLPVIAAYIAGIVLSIIHLERRAKYAPFVLAGCVVLLLVTLIFPFLQGYVMASGINRDALPMTEINRRMGALSLLHAVFFTTGIALLIAAAFTGRPARTVTPESTAASPPRSA